MLSCDCCFGKHFPHGLRQLETLGLLGSVLDLDAGWSCKPHSLRTLAPTRNIPRNRQPLVRSGLIVDMCAKGVGIVHRDIKCGTQIADAS